jgi:hypothetical protein
MKPKFSIFSTLGEALKLARQHPRLLLSLALFVTLQSIAFQWLLLTYQPPPMPDIHSKNFDAYTKASMMYSTWLAIFSLIISVVQMVVSALVTAAILGVLKPNSPEISTWTALSQSVRRCTWRLIIVSLLLASLTVAIIVPLELVLFAFGHFSTALFSYVLDFISVLLAIIYLVFIKYALAYPLVVVEGLGPLAALGRSWQMTRGRFWYVLGCYVFVGTAEHFLTHLSHSFGQHTHFTWLNAVDNLIGGLFTCYWIVLAWVMYKRIVDADKQLPEVQPTSF